jgi:hypothetical protein
MTILFYILLFLHIIGASMVVGIWIANMKAPTVHPRQRDGAFVQLITGIAMMGILPILHNQNPAEFDPNYFKLGIKFAVVVNPRMGNGRIRRLAGSLINDAEEWTWQRHAPHTLYGTAT